MSIFILLQLHLSQEITNKQQFYIHYFPPLINIIIFKIHSLSCSGENEEKPKRHADCYGTDSEYSFL